MDRLERARDGIGVASDRGGTAVPRQTDTVELGIFETDEDDLTREGPGPAVERIVEIRGMLDCLAEQAEVPAVAGTIGTDHDHLASYRSDHPQGG